MEMMEKIDKNKILIIGIYLIFLVAFIILFHLTKTNIDWFIETSLELKIPIDTRYNKPIYSIFFYVIMSTYYMVRALNICTSKLARTLIRITGYSFGLIAFYISSKDPTFSQPTADALYLLIALKSIYRHMHKSQQVET